MRKNNASKSKFSFRERLRSFSYAIEGVTDFFRTEHNAWIHLGTSILVFFFAWFISVSRTELLTLVIVVGLVWVAEIFNTALEKTMDLVSLEINKRIKRVKDLSAAAVLVSALIAFIVGCLIFIPKII